MFSLSRLVVAVLAITSLSASSPCPPRSPDQISISPLQSERVANCDCPPPFPRGTNESYVCGLTRLGHILEPQSPIVRNLMTGYKHFGGVSPCEFYKEWQKKDVHNQIDWRYPENHGFQVDDNKKVQKFKFTLVRGTLVDRFGRESGEYLSPINTPLALRALPPASLSDEYNVYKVIKKFTVWAGPIIPHFDQPGQGTQYFTGDVGKESDQKRTVKNLIDEGHLMRVLKVPAVPAVA